ncbi:hypothetical protein [Candidatus Enterovibrio escicola]|uniref:hypothetical protein n=1 Tax=Candidatus Enterovibrio escicola TaxID=1927127 RepID=UPI001238305C|nr:hypothetical protein [Candidatus Enterovibrio escacola]
MESHKRALTLTNAWVAVTGQHKVNFSCKGKSCSQYRKRYAREIMVKIGVCLFPRVSYRKVILTLTE